KLEQKTIDFEKLDETVPKDEPLPTIVMTTLGTTRAQAGSAANFRKIDQTYVINMAKLVHERAPKDPETGLSKVHFLYCSAANANERSFFLYPQVKGETERLLGEIGFERVSIFQPAFLKTEGERKDARWAEKVFGKVIIPVLDTVLEKYMSVDVGKVGKAMRIVATSETPEVGDVKPTVKIDEKSKTKVVYYSNPNILEIAKL
ncbi:Protein fmp52, mitochondrial, partial [Actinomortierella wolfii]